MSLSKSLLFPRLQTGIVVLRAIQTTPKTLGGHHIEYWWGHEKAAGREVVGHGVSGEPVSSIQLVALSLYSYIKISDLSRSYRLLVSSY